MRLRKQAEENGIGDEVLKAVIVQGLPNSFQKHLALKGVYTLEEIFEESLEFERVSTIETKMEVKQTNTIQPNNRLDKLELKLDQMVGYMTSLEQNRRDSRHGNFNNPDREREQIRLLP